MEMLARFTIDHAQKVEAQRLFMEQKRRRRLRDLEEIVHPLYDVTTFRTAVADYGNGRVGFVTRIADLLDF